MFECYKNIIGLSSFDNDCLSTGRPEDYNTSQSGLFLDQFARIEALLSATINGENIWPILTKAVDMGISTFVAQANALMVKHFSLRRQPVKKQVLGKIKGKEVYVPKRNYAVVRLACAPIRGGYFTLLNLGTIFEAVGAFEVSLYNNVDGFLETIDVATLANKHKANAVNKEYPLFSKYTECLEYYFVYEFDEENRPKDNDVDCGCGGRTLNFDLISPYFYGGMKNVEWTKYVMVGSSTINSLTELEDLNQSASNKMLGLTLELDFGCKLEEVICEESMDFVSNPLALSVAFAILYKAASEVARAILRDPNLYPETMINSDDWETDLLEWNEKFNEHLNYIVPQLDTNANGCLTCKDVLGAQRQGLFS